MGRILSSFSFQMSIPSKYDLYQMRINSGMKQVRDWLNRKDAIGNGIWNGKNESDVRTGLTGPTTLLTYRGIFIIDESSYLLARDIATGEVPRRMELYWVSSATISI